MGRADRLVLRDAVIKMLRAAPEGLTAQQMAARTGRGVPAVLNCVRKLRLNGLIRTSPDDYNARISRYQIANG